MAKIISTKQKEHIMKTPRGEIFYVFLANTNRLQPSPISYIQKLLTNEVKRKKQEELHWDT